MIYSGCGKLMVIPMFRKCGFLLLSFLLLTGCASTHVNNGDSIRSDEELQTVFDRHKSAIYRIYNKELRVNPALRGRVVLQLVIEPDGTVSSCTVQSTQLPAAFSAEIADRVKKINFGVESGPVITLFYPIDFLP